MARGNVEAAEGVDVIQIGDLDLNSTREYTNIISAPK
jgi:hypothetical protein